MPCHKLEAMPGSRLQGFAPACCATKRHEAVGRTYSFALQRRRYAGGGGISRFWAADPGRLDFAASRRASRALSTALKFHRVMRQLRAPALIEVRAADWAGACAAGRGGRTLHGTASDANRRIDPFMWSVQMQSIALNANYVCYATVIWSVLLTAKNISK